MLRNLLEGRTQERYAQRIKAEKDNGARGVTDEKVTVQGTREDE